MESTASACSSILPSSRRRRHQPSAAVAFAVWMGHTRHCTLNALLLSIVRVTLTLPTMYILVSGLYIKIYSRVYVVYTVVDMAVEEGRIDRHIVSSAAAQMLRSSSIITTSTSSGCSRHTNWFITPQKTPHHDFKIQIYTIFNTIYGS